MDLDRECDWVIKHKLIEAYRAKHDLPLTHPKVALIDLQYHDVNRTRGLFYRMQDAGLVERTCTDADIDEAVETPPQTTRARLRGEFIRRAKERKRDYTVDWVHLKLNDQAQRTVLCKDPFKVARRAGREAHRLAVVVPTFRTATVTALLEERPGLQRVDTDLGRGLRRSPSSSATVAVGDRVVVNTTAVELGLGTGGWHVVHWNTSRDVLEDPGPGHIMKLRYTSLQVDAGATEEHGDAPRPTSAACRWSSGSLHSQVPGRGGRDQGTPHPTPRVAYVMTDGAALPIAISRPRPRHARRPGSST